MKVLATAAVFWLMFFSFGGGNAVFAAEQVAVDFGANGLYAYDGSNLTELTSLNPESITSWNGKLVGDFGSYGLWLYDGNSWKGLTGWNAENIVALGSRLVADFGSYGIWIYDGSSWTGSTGWNPENITALGSKMAADFGSNGLWVYDGNSWKGLVGWNPENIVTWSGASSLAAVPKTGQTTSYAAGDDGSNQKGVALPNSRFTDNSNGTVTDNLTGLIWLKNANCFGTKSWTDALSACNSLAAGQCGLTDGSTAGQWRLPNRFELESLLDLSQYGPALPATYSVFTNVQHLDGYWTSTTLAGDATSTSHAWYVGMWSGDVTFKSKPLAYYVWPVRGGQ